MFYLGSNILRNIQPATRVNEFHFVRTEAPIYPPVLTHGFHFVRTRALNYLLLFRADVFLTRFQSRSQSFRYPWPAERENESSGSNDFEISRILPTQSYPIQSHSQSLHSITLHMFRKLDLSQRSRFLVLTKRSAVSGDDNEKTPDSRK